MEVTCTNCNRTCSIVDTATSAMCPNCGIELIARDIQDPNQVLPLPRNVTETGIQRSLANSAKKAASKGQNQPKQKSSDDSSADFFLPTDENSLGAPMGDETLRKAGILPGGASETKTPPRGVKAASQPLKTKAGSKAHNITIEKLKRIYQNAKEKGIEDGASPAAMRKVDYDCFERFHGFLQLNLSPRDQKEIFGREIEQEYADYRAGKQPQIAEKMSAKDKKISQEITQKVETATHGMSIEEIKLEKLFQEAAQMGLEVYDPAQETPVDINDLNTFKKNYQVLEEENEKFEREIGELRAIKEPSFLEKTVKYGLLIGVVTGAVTAAAARRIYSNPTIVEGDFDKDGYLDRALLYPTVPYFNKKIKQDQVYLGQRDGTYKELEQVFEDQKKPIIDKYDAKLARLKPGDVRGKAKLDGWKARALNKHIRAKTARKQKIIKRINAVRTFKRR